MPGSLVHSKEFRIVPYTGSDGQSHYEVEPIDGDADAVSYTSWEELKDYCSKHGVPLNAWPEFNDCECGVDIPLSLARSKQEGLRKSLLALQADCVSGCVLLQKIVEYLTDGQAVFFY
jgi:hypothetical protein